MGRRLLVDCYRPYLDEFWGVAGDMTNVSKKVNRFVSVTLFPEMFQAITEYGVTARAIKRGLVEVSTINPRDFAEDKHRTVDDRPYGGGPGMLMMVEPLRKAISKAKETIGDNAHVVYLSPQGQPITQSVIKRLSQQQNLVLVSGALRKVLTSG